MKKKTKTATKKKTAKKTPETLPAVKQSDQVAKITEKDIDEYLFGSNTNLTPSQKTLFKKTAIAFNLNPFKREVYAIPFGGRMSIITGYEVYINRANKLNLLDGWHVEMSGVKKDGTLKATITIHRKGWSEPFIHDVYFNEYDQNNSMWQKKPITMLKKVAMSQGFRLCFPEEFAGMPYTTDEMPLKDNDYNNIGPDKADPVEAEIVEKDTATEKQHKEIDDKIGKAAKILDWNGKKFLEYIKFSHQKNSYKSLDYDLKLKILVDMKSEIDSQATK